VWVYRVWARDGAERREGRQRVVKEKTTRGGGREGGGRSGRRRERLAVAVGKRAGEQRGKAKDAK